MRSKFPLLLLLLFSFALAPPSRAAEVNIPDHSFAPDGSSTNAYQQTDIATPNGGNVLPAGSSSHIAYFVTTFTFGTGSDAHLQANFRATAGQPRVGVEVQDSGLVQFVGTGDSTQTNFNLNQDMAGETVVVLVKAHYDPNHNVVYGKSNAADDTLFNAWINPTGASVEGSGQSAGDMQTVWNSATFGFFGQTVQNQSTPGTAGTSFITDTTVLTGSDATFANALALATGGTPPTGIVDAGTSTVSASPTAVPADGTTTSAITVTLNDAGGHPVAGKEVSLSGNGSAIITTGSNISDANGEVTFAVRSSSVGMEVFTATDVTDSNLLITQTASVDFTDPQDAEAFNVNFIDDGQANATGLVGVVGDPGETWNQGTTSVSNLVDTTGTVVSSVSVSGLGGDGRPLSADLSVFDGNRGLFGKGGDVTISITGLTPDAAYDLYIYSLSHNAAPWGDIANTERAAGDFVTTNTVLGNGQSQFLDNATPGTGDATFVPNGNYVTFESIIADGSGSISILVDAYDGADGNLSTNDGNTRLQVNGLQIRPASGMSVDYTAWRNTYYPGLGLPGEDDDRDTFTNDYEYIFGMDPTDPSSTQPFPEVVDPATGYFSYSRRTKSLANLNYKVWYSTDLDQWFEDNAAFQRRESVANDVEVMGVNVNPDLLGEDKLFIQVRATTVSGVDPEPSLVNLWGSGSSITVLFSEPMNPSSASNPDNYTVVQDGGGTLAITGTTLSSDGGSVTLTLGSTLGLDTGYTVSINGVNSDTGQSLAPGLNRQFTTWDDDPTGVKVFILAGQSNMVGFGNVENGNTGAGALGSLRFMAVNNDNPEYNYYDYTSLLVTPTDTSSAFRNRADVKVWWREGGNGQLGGAISKGDLGPPYKGRDSGKIGPEFGFGQVIGDYYASDDVLVIKTAWGGRDLAEKFRPPTAVAKRGGQVGEFYSAIIDYTREVLNDLGGEFGDWNDGRGYEIVGFGWHQGYNDRISTAFSAEYKDNLPDLISDLREVFNKPDLPFVIASTGMGGGAVDPTYASYSEVEKAQLWVAGVTQPDHVRSTDTRPFWRDPADSPATTGQGFHWNHNAESQFLIGKALGDNMVILLSE